MVTTMWILKGVNGASGETEKRRLVITDEVNLKALVALTYGIRSVRINQ